MEMKTHNKLLVFCVLFMFMLCLSVVNASEITNNTTNTIDDNVQSTDNQEQCAKELINSEDITEKEVSKKESTENVKTEKQVTVNSYQQLLEEVENAKKGTEKTYTINLNPGNYDVTNIILWDNTTVTAKKLIINGNNNIISGKNNYAFINVTSGNKLELNNIMLKNFKTAIRSWTGGSVTLYNTIITNNTGEDGGAIFLSNAKVTLYNTTLSNNTANKSSGAIYSFNRSTVTVYNSTLSNNKANNNAGAIYSYDRCTLTLYNSTLTNNTAMWEGGAIHSMGNLMIYNTTLNNNTGDAGGAIYSENSNVTISNSILNYNTANEYGYGGAIYSKYSNVTINYTTLNNNTANEYGGAIYTYNANLTLHDSTLNNNTGERGGAIASFQKNITVHNCTLNNNTANEEGGAIFAYGSNLTVNYTTINNNTAKYGGAIYSNSYFRKYVRIYNSLLTNNTANEEGGAIYSYNNNVTINNTTLNYNTAKYGGAIFSNDSNLMCSNTNMISNHAGYRGGAIYYKNNNETLNYSDIKFLNNSAIEGKNIYFVSAQTRIELNDTIGVYRDKISITGKVINVKNSKMYISDYITYDIDGIKGRTSADYYGVFNISIKLNETGTKKVYVEYKGNEYYLPSNITKTLTVSKRNTIIEVEELAKSVGSVTVNGRLTDPTNSKLINANIYVTLNGETQHLFSDMNGKFTTNFTVTKTGTNELSIIYNGNKNYEGTSYTTTLNLISEKDANIMFFNIEPTTYHNYTKINGKLTDKNGNTYENTIVSIIVNNEMVDAKTNSKGQFTINYLTNKAGTNNVTTVYQKTETPLKTFTVIKRTTKLLVNQTKNAKQKQTVMITGQLLDQCDVKLKNANIYIKINEQTYHVMTNNDGIYTLDYTTEIKGLNNVTVTYKGNSNYEKTTQKTSFQVN